MTHPLPQNSADLKKLYEETVFHHREFLDRLQSSFDKRCDEIGNAFQQKIDQLPPEEEDQKQQLLQEQQAQLNKTLQELKYAINKSNADAMQKLEQIQNKLEGGLDIDQELENLD